AAARVLALPDEVRSEVVRLMERFVAATPVDSATFRTAAIAAYGEALGLQPVSGWLSASERERLLELDGRFRSPAWLRGPGRPAPQCGEVKVRAGVHVVWTEQEGRRALATVVGEHLKRGEAFGSLEAAKFVGPLTSPLSGRVTATNDAVVVDPALVERDPYSAGWLVEMDIADAGELGGLVSGAQPIRVWFEAE